MTGPLFIVASLIVTVIFHVLIIDAHQLGYFKGYDKGLEDAIETFQQLMDEESEELECSKL